MSLDVKRTNALLKQHGVSVSKLLGSGAFSDVFKGTTHSSSGTTEMAVKCYHNILSPALSNSDVMELAKTEFLRCKELNHPNIARVLQFVCSSSITFMGLQLATGGDLFDRINSREKFNAEGGLNLLKGILAGLTFMHTKANLVHMDLKTENVLLTGDGVPMLTDMDAAVPCFSQLQVPRGTRNVHPPELLESSPTSEPKLITPSIDMWAVGLIAHLVIAGRYAWDTAVMSDMKYAEFRKVETTINSTTNNDNNSPPTNIWNAMPTTLHSMFASVFSIDEAKRPTAQELSDTLETIWVTDVVKLGVKKATPEVVKSVASPTKQRKSGGLLSRIRIASATRRKK